MLRKDRVCKCRPGLLRIFRDISPLQRRVSFGAIRKKPKDRWGWFTHDFIVLSHHPPSPIFTGVSNKNCVRNLTGAGENQDTVSIPARCRSRFEMNSAAHPWNKCAYVLQNFGAAQAPHRTPANLKFSAIQGPVAPEADAEPIFRFRGAGQ